MRHDLQNCFCEVCFSEISKNTLEINIPFWTQSGSDYTPRFPWHGPEEVPFGTSSEVSMMVIPYLIIKEIPIRNGLCKQPWILFYCFFSVNLSK